MDVSHLTEMHLDVLKEIGNIGAAHGATALSAFLDRRIDMQVPQVRILPFPHLEEAIGGAEVPVAGVYLAFSGEMEGTILFMLDQPSTRHMKEFFNWVPGITDGDAFSKEDISLLKEVGNILTGAYLSALHGLTGLTAIPSVPLFAYDMVGAILSVPMTAFGQTGEYAMFIEAVFLDGERRIRGHFFIIPEFSAFQSMLNALGIP